MEELDEFTRTILESCEDTVQADLLELLEEGYSLEEAIEILQL